MTITSQHNRKLKEIRKLRQRRRWRERSGRFVAEGEDLLAAADAAGWEAVERYCAVGSGLPGTEVEGELLASASGLGSSTRTLATYEERWVERPLGPVCVYLHGVGDPGNVGTILRSAQAFGASSVALGPGTADPFSLKAVRASMGAVFAVPLARVPAGTADLDALPGVRIALVPGEGLPLREALASDTAQRYQMPKLRGREAGDAAVEAGEAAVEAGEAGEPAGAARPGADASPGSITLLVGAERDGLPADIVVRADRVAHVPIATESLNAAMAATIALYELRTSAPFG
jgi:RNA methyltransferase, TrmH family